MTPIWIGMPADAGRHVCADETDSRSLLLLHPKLHRRGTTSNLRYMDKLTPDAMREIEQIHSSWIAFEVAGQNHGVVTLCAEDIELWPPDASPVLGRAAVSAQLERGTVRIHDIEITDRRIRGSNEIAYLTASYKTTFSSAEESAPRQARGSHVWILEKQAGRWVVSLVSWSVHLSKSTGLPI
jgi:ketosteroid isomerase-like protein